jgi:transcription elongation factor Elf1
MRAKPCPRCGNKELAVGDCGYSKFNVAWVHCKKCKLYLEVSGDSAVKTWNAYVKNPLAKHVKELKERNERKESLRPNKDRFNMTLYICELLESILKDQKNA